MNESTIKQLRNLFKPYHITLTIYPKENKTTHTHSHTYYVLSYQRFSVKIAHHNEHIYYKGCKHSQEKQYKHIAPNHASLEKGILHLLEALQAAVFSPLVFHGFSFLDYVGRKGEQLIFTDEVKQQQAQYLTVQKELEALTDELFSCTLYYIDPVFTLTTKDHLKITRKEQTFQQVELERIVEVAQQEKDAFYKKYRLPLLFDESLQRTHLEQKGMTKEVAYCLLKRYTYPVASTLTLLHTKTKHGDDASSIEFAHYFSNGAVLVLPSETWHQTNENM